MLVFDIRSLKLHAGSLISISAKECPIFLLTLQADDIEDLDRDSFESDNEQKENGGTEV